MAFSAVSITFIYTGEKPHYTGADSSEYKDKSTLIKSDSDWLLQMLEEHPEDFSILFELRSSKIEAQPGDICFPGGMQDPGETIRETVVREMCEELLIRPDQVTILGQMDYLQSGSRLRVYPFITLLEGYQGSFSSDEVEEVFTVPFTWFLQNKPEVYYTESKVILSDDFPYDRIYGGKNYAWRSTREPIYFYRYIISDIENLSRIYDIWGMTAKMIYHFTQKLVQSPV